MTRTTDKDKELSVDLRFALCLFAADKIERELSELYAAIWIASSCDDQITNERYRRYYREVLRYIAEGSSSLAIDDQFKEQYEESKNG